MPTVEKDPRSGNDGETVTRFAPSPTGYLHIGGARTALFNWLYARGRGGKFHLRIEDTDRARHNDEAVAAILDGLSWLGLDWDGEPVSQYARRQRHVEIAEQLLSDGKAYKCWLAGDELSAARENAKAKSVRFESPWRDRNRSEGPADEPFAIRFRAPQEGETVVDDTVQGAVRFPNSALDDLVILRSDGNPTYNLAVVVDDHDMAVTHVIRGDDHLNNAARQTQIYGALGWPTPQFAHVPLIHGADGAKLSKRHGALGVEAYRDMGFLPEGLANYFIRLGWSHGDEEFIPREKALAWFDLDTVKKAPARLDPEKLKSINAQYMAQLSDEAFYEKSTPFIEASGVTLDTDNIDRLQRAAPFLKTRCATLADAPDAAAFLFLARPLTIEGKAAKPLAKDGAREMLIAIDSALADDALWSTPASLDEALQKLAEEKNVGFGAVGPPLRAALTAGKPSPSLGEVLYSLGADEARARIRDIGH